MSGTNERAIERVVSPARIVGLADLLKPRPAPKRDDEAASIDTEAAPFSAQPDPRVLIEQERQRMLEAARKEGFAAGMRDAEKNIEARALEAERIWEQKYSKEAERLSDAARHLEALVKALPEAISAIERDAESLVIQATFAATSRVVSDAARDDALVLGYCREALAEYAMRPIVLRVHPTMLVAVKDALADAEIRVEGDARLASSQCRVESAKGLYDISLEHRLDALKQQLLASLDIQPGPRT
jgi:flagellar assembly protein FliH